MSTAATETAPTAPRRSSRPALAVVGPDTGASRKHVPTDVRRRTASAIIDELDAGTPANEVVDRYAKVHERSRRQIERWVKEERRRRAAQLLDRLGGEQPTVGEVTAARGALAGRPKFEITEDLYTVVAAAPSLYQAWLHLRYVMEEGASPVARHQTSKSTFYAAYKRLPEGLRHGLRHGSVELAGHVPHVTRDITRFGQSYSYDLKNLRVFALRADGQLHNDNWLLSFRDEASLFYVGRWVLDHVPTDAEVAACFAEAVRGCEHDNVVIAGSPSTLRTDNGANLNGPMMRRAASMTATMISPTSSYNSAGNGRHERGHLDIDTRMRTLPGYTGLARKRGDKPYVPTGALTHLTFEELTQVVFDAVDDFNFQARPDTDRHNGRTPFEMAAALISAGETELRDTSDEMIASFGLPLPSRVYKVNAGTLRWDNAFYIPENAASLHAGSYTATCLPNDPTVVFVFDAGRYVCTATRVDVTPPETFERITGATKRIERIVDRHQEAAQRLLGAGSWSDALRTSSKDASGLRQKETVPEVRKVRANASKSRTASPSVSSSKSDGGAASNARDTSDIADLLARNNVSAT
jgi:hypothetical protein